jgi:protein SCO1/2
MLLLASCGESPVVIVQGDGAPDAPSGTVLDPPKQLADFTLISQSGAPLSLQDLRGKPSLVFFGYTNCPDVCPLTMTEWKKIKQNLGDAAADINFVFISVDPERDTPDVVGQFLKDYDPSFVGLTGDVPAIQRIAQDFGLYFQVDKDNSGKPLVEHSSSSFLLDRDARLHIVYSYNMPVETVSRDIRAVLAQAGGT